MSNNYVQFCMQVPLAHGRSIARRVRDLLDAGIAQRKAENERGEDAEAFDFDFTWEGDTALFLQSDEHGNVVHAATFVQDLMVRRLAKEPAYIFWAETSDRSLPGHFSGGGVLITAERCHWFVPVTLAAKKWKAIQKRRQGRK